MKGLKQTPRAANDSIRSLENLAHSLDVNVGEAFKEFISTQDTLAQYGDRNIEVFANLKAQSVATGVGISNLAKVANKLDTFKGAAQAAQGFNAVMGKTVLSVTDLVHADPAEKIELLKTAMERSGMTFDGAHRRIKNIVAGMVGLSVADASKMFGSKQDYFDISAGIDTTATSTEDLEERIKSSMSVSENLQRSMSNLGQASSKMLKRAHREANKANTFLLNMFKDIRKEVGSSEEALIAFLGHVVVAGKATQKAKATARGLGGAALGITMAEAMAKKMGVDIIPEDLIYMLEDQVKADFGGLDGTLTPDGFIGDPKNNIRSTQMTGKMLRESQRTAAAAPAGVPGGGAPGPAPKMVAQAGGTSMVVNIVANTGELIDSVEVEAADFAEGLSRGMDSKFKSTKLRFTKPIYVVG